MKRSERLRSEARREWLLAACGLLASLAGVVWCGRIYQEAPGAGVVLGILIAVLGGAFVLGCISNATRCARHAWDEERRERMSSIRTKAHEGRRMA